MSEYAHIPNLFKQRNNINSNQTNFKKLTSLALIVNYYVITTLFIWQFCLTKYMPNINSAILFLYLLSVVFIVSNLKLIMILVIDTLFNRRDHFHIRLHLYYFQVLGLIVLPIYVLSFYLGDNIAQDSFLNGYFTKMNLYFVAALLFITIIIIREIKSLLTALNNRISLLYIILYLCTLEILPLILVIKILR